ncbi:hypothetical protein [Microbacterium sp. cf332]|uniref:hypothetical protein n=1 Tax=Microbacterium sp. cf332 TaxID=1761804 RepID=UPI0008893CC4|nr:hypothetical protein [Microbacterium sp. cf332]SDQ45531.1 hypothetical protein SAMN04487847_1478 [Microbacterium sp. cf332]
MRRSRTAPIAAVVVSAALLLAACDAGPGGGDPTGTAGTGTPRATPAATPTGAGGSPSTPSAPSAESETVIGTGYSFAVPAGWSVPAQDPTDGQVDVFVTESADAAARYISVVVSPGVITADDVEADGISSLEAVGATEVTLEDRVDIGGSESAHLVASLVTEEGEVIIDQYYASRDDQTYVITFASPADTADAERLDTADTVLSSWTWD